MLIIGVRDRARDKVRDWKGLRNRVRDRGCHRILTFYHVDDRLGCQ